MIRRTNKDEMFKLLEDNKDWKVVDIASGRSGWKYADIFTDVCDHSEFYEKRYNGEKTFIKCDVENLIFKDKEFDFVVASHILTNFINPFKFCKELTRIGKRGYIEVPTPLWDNLVDGPNFVKYGHKWWVTFDDVEKNIIINRKINIIDKVLTIQEHNNHMMFFKDSAITRLYWEDDIPIKMGDGIYKYNDGRFLDLVFDSNCKKDWNNKYLFKFGSGYVDLNKKK